MGDKLNICKMGKARYSKIVKIAEGHIYVLYTAPHIPFRTDHFLFLKIAILAKGLL